MKQNRQVGKVPPPGWGDRCHVKMSAMADKKRVDQLLVEQGLAGDLEHARRLVMAGKVLFRDQVMVKASQQVPSASQLQLVQDPPFVSRGGEKLQAAFAHFPLSVKGVVCADVGASTGGFTDCLLQNGASRVYAVDVGYGLLDWSLRNDPRVVVLERTNARNLAHLPEQVGFISVDVSFISLDRIFPVLPGWIGPGGGEAVVLIKPQFEAEREESARGAGVIKDPKIHRRVLVEVLSSAAQAGFQARGLLRSPVLGPAGNQEFLAWLAAREGEPQTADWDDLISPLFPDSD